MNLTPKIDTAAHPAFRWDDASVHTESTMHQLSPYIGKLKSTIAHRLITLFSKSGDLVVDPYAGSGTIPFEAQLLGRRIFASDISTYSQVLVNAKLFPPSTEAAAVVEAEKLLDESSKLAPPDLRQVPQWVRQYFHPQTLKDAIRFASVCRQHNNNFVFACFLGILHHQRPGFLSYPCSHLVPYLRDKKFPVDEYPNLYEYREIRTRLLAKIARAYKRYSPPLGKRSAIWRLEAAETVQLPRQFDCLITSPPYMNALDYYRDNRLRLWFTNPDKQAFPENDLATIRTGFVNSLTQLLKTANSNLRKGGFCVFVVGDSVSRKTKTHPAEMVSAIAQQHAPSLQLRETWSDSIPDIRRSRRECHGTKTELFLVFRSSF